VTWLEVILRPWAGKTKEVGETCEIFTVKVLTGCFRKRHHS
jgi:hypothetical protein